MKNSKDSFYDSLSSNYTMGKTASEKDPVQLRADIESTGLAGDQITAIAQEIMGYFPKTAEVLEPEQEAAATPTIEDNVIAADPTLTEDAKNAALEAVRANAADLTSSVDTLVAIENSMGAGTEGSEAIQATANAKLKGLNKKAEEDEDDEEEEDEEAKETNKEIERVMTEGTEEEKEDLVKSAYDHASLDLINRNITPESYAASRIGEVLASEVMPTIEKLASLSDINIYRVTDDFIGALTEKVASAE